jgi:hypothetical protein
MKHILRETFKTSNVVYHMTCSDDDYFEITGRRVPNTRILPVLNKYEATILHDILRPAGAVKRFVFENFIITTEAAEYWMLNKTSGILTFVNCEITLEALQLLVQTTTSHILLGDALLRGKFAQDLLSVKREDCSFPVRIDAGNIIF